MKKLWQKNWQLNEFIEVFETKEDIVMDQKLIPYDIYCSIAHAEMLTKIGILSAKELIELKKGFKEIFALYNQGKFVLTMGEEDMHTKIENYITQHYGEVGKKMHTGRSRNDQVLVALRLFGKDQLLVIMKETLSLIQLFITFAKRYEFMPMPGYTHMQQAMPSSVGMWAGAFTEGLLDDYKILQNAYEIIDQSPLGSGAGYGVPLPLDREYTAKLLGFKKIQENPIYCQNSRGKLESTVVHALITVLFDINRFATDIMVFTMAEFGYFMVAKELTSGSSIMPQKRNVDVAELLRSKVHVVNGYYQQVLQIGTNLISGYNRDLQDTKKPFVESLLLTKDCILVTKLLLENLTPNEKNMEKGLTKELFATHYALDLVQNGMPFREAYQKTAANLETIEVPDIKKVLRQAKHIGATGNIGIKKIEKTYMVAQKKVQTEEKQLTAVLKKLI